MRSWILGFVMVACAGLAQAAFQSGVHYTELSKPVQTADPSKIEVVELFWYGCPHCDSLDPALEAWKAQLPEDVQFVRLPVVFGRNWEMHARMFWVAKNLGILDQVHTPLFNALHRENKRLLREDEAVEFLARFGADPAVVRRELKGFATESGMRLADARARAYGISGVPAMVIDGRYVTGVGQAGSQQALFTLINALIEQRRSARVVART